MATIFTPQNLSPRNEVRDMSINQPFSGVVDGVRYTDYQLFIYRVSNGTLVYNSNKQTFTPNLSDGETFEITVPSGSVANSATETYKWKLQVWNGTETVTTREFAFTAKDTPILTFTPPSIVTSQSYEFTATLAQAQGDIPNNYTFELYDNINELIESSGLITNFNIRHTFDGFSDGDTFKVRVFGTTTGAQLFDSGLVEFSVDYQQPELDLKPIAVSDNVRGVVNLLRGDVVQIIGDGSGSFSYNSDWLYDGNNALTLDNPLSTAFFDVIIPINFTLSVKWQPLSNDFEGKIIELGNSTYEVGYQSGGFYYTINGVTQFSPPIDIYGSVFYIVLQPQSCTFIATKLFNQWNTLPFGMIWNDLIGQTWEDIGLI